MVSCDVYRPAAIEQLKTVAGQAGGFFRRHRLTGRSISRKRQSIGEEALHDVLLVDTAGRLSIDEAMMKRLPSFIRLFPHRNVVCSLTPCSGRTRSIRRRRSARRCR